MATMICNHFPELGLFSVPCLKPLNEIQVTELSKNNDLLSNFSNELNTLRKYSKFPPPSIDALKEEFSYTNVMQVPKLERIVVSRGVGSAVADKKLLEYAVEELTNITGQKAIATVSKKDVANFKLRKGVPIGAKVTLRNKKMYEFLDRLVNIAIPRIRDFRGLNPNSFDGSGNYSMGIKEQIIFPEINYDKIDKVRGLNITICTTAKNNSDALELLKCFNMPFLGREES